MKELTITIREDQRQAILLALAHLALERPGWDPCCLTEIALLMDNRLPNGRPEMYEEFKRLHVPGEYYKPEPHPEPETGANYTIDAEGRSIRCHKCGMTSWNLNDVREKYCGHCHKFHEKP
jgi:hypothetical protein